MLRGPDQLFCFQLLKHKCQGAHGHAREVGQIFLCIDLAGVIQKHHHPDFLQRKPVFQGGNFQIPVQQLAAAVRGGQDPFSCYGFRTYARPFPAELCGSGEYGGRYSAVFCGADQKPVYLETVFFIFFFIQHMFVKTVIVFKNSKLHADRVYNCSALGYERALCFYVIIDRRFQRVKGFRM